MLHRKINTFFLSPFYLKPSKGWWHQVESLDLSVSVNIWNPNEPQDSDHRTKEAMTRIIANICKHSAIPIPTLDDDFGDLGWNC